MPLFKQHSVPPYCCEEKKNLTKILKIPRSERNFGTEKVTLVQILLLKRPKEQINMLLKDTLPQISSLAFGGECLKLTEFIF